MDKIIKKITLLLVAFAAISCSNDVPAQGNKPVWNIDEALENDFWTAINKLEKHGVNIKKLRSEDIEVIFVDDIDDVDGADHTTVAAATKCFKDGIRILVLKDKWVTTEYEGQQNDENISTMLHEIGHDLFNLPHYEDEWDIMNGTSEIGEAIDQQKVSRSIDRMMLEGRRVYDSLSLVNRF